MGNTQMSDEGLTMGRRVLAVLLSVVLAFSLLPATAFVQLQQAWAEPVSYDYSVLVLDTSGSMYGTPGKVQKEAACLFCESILKSGNAHKIAVVKLNTRAYTACDFTDDEQALKTAINSSVYSGGTNYGSALSAAQTLLDGTESASLKNIVFCSDGLPESGTRSSNGPYSSSDHIDYGYANYACSVADTIKDKGVLIYTLGFFHSLSGEDLTFGRRLMNDLQNAGYYDVVDPGDLTGVFGQVAEDVATGGDTEFNIAASDISFDGVPATQGYRAFYTGYEIKPRVEVYCDDSTSENKKKLMENIDFEVGFKDNTDVGKATVTVTGVGAYHGTKTATFTIAELSSSATPVADFVAAWYDENAKNVKYLATNGNFPSFIMTSNNAPTFAKKLVNMTENCIFRGKEGWANQFTGSLKQEDAEKTLIALLVHESDASKSIAKADEAKQVASGFVKALNLDMKMWQTADTEDVKRLERWFTSDKVADMLVKGKFKDIQKAVQDDLGFSENSDAMKELTGFLRSRKATDFVSKQLKYVGDGLTVADAAVDVLDKVVELRALKDAHVNYGKMLDYLADHCEGNIVKKAAEHVKKEMNSNYESSHDEIIKVIAKDGGSWAVDTAIDKAMEAASVYALAAKMGLEAGIFLGNTIFGTSTTAEAEEQLVNAAFIASSLSDWALDSCESFCNDYNSGKNKADDGANLPFDPADSKLESEAGLVLYSAQTLLTMRNKCEQALRSYIGSFSFILPMYKKAYAEHVNLSNSASDLLSDKQRLMFGDLSLFSTLDSTSKDKIVSYIACPVDVEILKNGNVVAILKDGVETSGAIEDISYRVEKNPVSGEYVKYISLPDNGQYSYRIVGIGDGAVDYVSFSVDKNSRLERSGFESEPVSQGAVISIPKVSVGSDGEYEVVNNSGITTTKNTSYDFARTGVRKVVVSDNISYMIKDDGTLWACGTNARGQLGLGTSVDGTTTFIKVLDRVSDIYTYGGGTFATKDDGSLWSWGFGQYDTLGVGIDRVGLTQYTPTKILDDVSSVSLSGSVSAAVTDGGDLYTWGYGGSGNLGTGTICETSPKKVLSGVRSVAVGNFNTFAVKNDGSLLGWGDKDSLGVEINQGSTSSPVTIMDGVSSVFSSGSTHYALKEDGSLWGWGFSGYGLLGAGALNSTLSKTPIHIMDDVTNVCINDDSDTLLVLDSSGSVWSLGGNPTIAKQANYLPMKIIDGAHKVLAGGSYYEGGLAALMGDGSLYTWGGNTTSGILGNGSTDAKNYPEKILDGISDISVGSSNMAAITSDGSLLTWGSNKQGNLGDGTTTDSSIPKKVVDSTSAPEVSMPKLSEVSVGDLTISNIQDKVYTGAEVTQDPVVSYGERLLTEGADYDVSYADNTAPGEATVTVTGRGMYRGSKTLSFEITQLKSRIRPKSNLAAADISPVSDQTYTGSAIEPSITVTLNGKTLTRDTDYTVSYSDNVNAGTATVMVTGKGNYTGSASAVFTIAPRSLSDATEAIATQTYTGSALEPEVTVTLDGKTLVHGTDYTIVSYADNVEVGMATVTLAGRGNYTGTTTGRFRIISSGKSGTWHGVSYDIDAAGAVTFHDGTMTGGFFSSDPFKDNEVLKNATSVKASGKVVLPKDSSDLFHGCSNLVSIDMKGFDASHVSSMHLMFYGCTSLRSLDLSGFDVSRATDTSWMFCSCTSLSSLDVSSFDTSDVKKMDCMFSDCPSLSSIDVSNFDTSAVEDMDNMFSHCSSLSYLNLSGFNTSNVRDMSYMFYGCSSLPSLDLSSFETSKVTGMTSMFENCSSLKSVKLGAKFSFNGSRIMRLCSLTDGAWYSSVDGIGYAADAIPNNVAAIYTRNGSVDLSGATISAIVNQTCTGSAIEPSIKVTLNGKMLTRGTDYTVSYSNNVSIGTATVTVTGKGNYTGTATATFAIVASDNGFNGDSTSTAKNPNPIIAVTNMKSLGYKSLKKKAKKVRIYVAGAQGQVSYAKAKKGGIYKKVSVSKKGVITFKKETKKGTYKFKVTAAGNDQYESKTVTLKVRVK